MAVIGIHYDGGNYHDDDDQLVEHEIGYQNVYLHTGKGEFIYDSEDFVKDWFNAKKKYVEVMDEEPWLSGSSSCDHFITDGAKFDSAYLHTDAEGNPELRYIDYSDENWLSNQRHVYENGWEMFVNQGETPTWKELSEYCKND
jgi:hypothetical protein